MFAPVVCSYPEVPLGAQWGGCLSFPFLKVLHSSLGILLVLSRLRRHHVLLSLGLISSAGTEAGLGEDVNVRNCSGVLKQYPVSVRGCQPQI